MNLDGLHFAREDLFLRYIPFGLEYKFICSSIRACEGSQRFRKISSPLPGADEDYPLINFCLEHVHFFYLDILL